ncbi:MAG TPA: histidine ammonia-lyase, partial [Anaerolineae bacterium]|nr:histidine ammonia-lyase [Anaerolineae bacterium]
MTETLTIDGDHLTLEDVVAVARAWSQPRTLKVVLSPEAREKVRRSRQAVEEFVAHGEIIYGITTGFGAFKDRIIPPDQVTQLQHNIIMSHAVGVGEPFDQATTRALMLIRANTLAKGYS